MTEKQQRFVEEYAVDGNATQAAIRAGYKARRAHEVAYQLLRKTQVAEAIKLQRQERAAAVALDAEWAISQLMGITEEARATGQYGSALNGVQQALRYLGIQGTDKSESTHTVRQVTREELDAEAQRLREEYDLDDLLMPKEPK